MDYTDYNTLCGKMLLGAKLATVSRPELLSSEDRQSHMVTEHFEDRRKCCDGGKDTRRGSPVYSKHSPLQLHK